MKYQRSLIFFLITGLSITGCKLESPEGATQNQNPTAYIDGSVKDSNDEPLSDVSVEITTHKSTCKEPGVNHGVVKTDSDGKFLKVVVRPEEETVNCLTLHTSSKVNRNLKDSTITRSADLDFKLSDPFDHETVNISY